MKRVYLSGAAVALLLLVGAAHKPAALSAPLPVKPAAGGMADLLDGKMYPRTIGRDELIPTYHLVGLVDAQGHTGSYATKGDIVTLAGESFLVVYIVPPPPKPADTDPGAGDAQLSLINMHYVQAIGGIGEVTPATLNPPQTPASAAPAAPVATP